MSGHHPDASNGWEGASAGFIRQCRQSVIGVAAVRRWAEGLPPGATVLDLGAGPGGHRSAVLEERGCVLYAVEAAPTLAAAYRARFPAARVACEPAEASAFFGQAFDGILAWGLLFLLPPEIQLRVIERVGGALAPGGRFLFTAPREPTRWPDLTTGRESVGLGAPAYESALIQAGMRLVETSVDEGENHYYHAITVPGGHRSPSKPAP